MSKLGDGPNPLEYQSPQPGKDGTGCLVLSILLAVGVGMLCAIAIIALLDEHRVDLVIALVGCPVLLTILAVKFRERGMRMAVAITLISLTTFARMFGLCAFS